MHGSTDNSTHLANGGSIDIPSDMPSDTASQVAAQGDAAPLHELRRLLDRRSLIGLGLRAGLGVGGLLLAGCQAGVRGSTMPGPVWPDDPRTRTPRGGTPLPPRTTNPPRPPASRPAQPAPNYAAMGVMPRSSWTRSPVIMSRANPLNGVSRITIHHDAIPSTGLRTSTDSVSRLNSVRSSHLQRGWADIGYHFVIDPTGRVWEGRPLSLQGAHVSDNNEHNLGIMLMGNFDRHAPTAAQLASLDAFVVSQMRSYRVPLARVFTHQEIKPTACPGRNLQRYVAQSRSRGGRIAMG
ncbi:MAG: peptidoglycan recognition family protein [Planctomycetota bacterium]|nr:peptidoglycan recognition family protein [Planctomycetota bacterium]